MVAMDVTARARVCVCVSGGWGSLEMWGRRPAPTARVCGVAPHYPPAVKTTVLLSTGRPSRNATKTLAHTASTGVYTRTRARGGGDKGGGGRRALVAGQRAGTQRAVCVHPDPPYPHRYSHNTHTECATCLGARVDGVPKL